MPRLKRRPRSRKDDLAAAIRRFLSDTTLDQFSRFARSLFVFPGHIGIGRREVSIREIATGEWFLARLKATPGETLLPGERPFSEFPDIPPSLPPRDRGVLLLPSEPESSS